MKLVSDRWKTVAQLFEKALDAEPSEREALLQRECGGDVKLREEVERLLANEARAGGDFLVPASQTSKLDGVELEAALLPHPSPLVGGEGASLAAAVGPDPLLGRTIGVYTIRSVIARGGMGSVYLAIQERPHREVALKIMTSSFWSHTAQRRFEFETETLGRLHHPNIAQVYESGVHRFETGATAPFFAMEYIPGARPITAYCDERGLDLHERLRVFGMVCDAVYYGHQKGVVHRDLKPANILVDDHGHVKVIDFGVARSTESDIAMTTMHTETGQLVGTLAYMSPEQCGGSIGTDVRQVRGGTGASPVEGGTSPSQAYDIDTRSDVYSLGVVLFELLTGRLPYDVSHMTIHAATRVICEQEPAKPSSMKSTGIGVSPAKLRGDLETIVLKAIEKDRARRYDSAAAVAEDVQRYLRGEPISARPPTRWTKAVRWAGRHPIGVTAAICLAIASFTFIATIVLHWYLYRQPHSIGRYNDGQELSGGGAGQTADEVRLLSRSHYDLHSWKAGVHGNLFAEFVEHPVHGSRALIGFTNVSTHPFAKRLCLFDVNGDLEEPLWHKKIENSDVLPKLSQREDKIDGDSFAFHRCRIADVFPGDDHPGDEVVAVFCTEYSQRVIRIYDLSNEGRLLFEAWHDGSVVEPWWMADVGLLVFLGDDHQRDWDDFGKPTTAETAPLIAFAIRPTPGSINRADFLNSDATLSQLEKRNGPPWLAWYMWLYAEGDKPARADKYSLEFRWPARKGSERYFAINVIVKAGDASIYPVGWDLDEFGNAVSGTWVIGENYKKARERRNQSGEPPLPDPYQFRLADQRPRNSTVQRDADQ